MNREIEPHELNKVGIVAVTEERSEVGWIILVRVDGRELPVTVDVTEDPTGNDGELGDEVHGVVECGLPVLALVYAVAIGFGEGGVVVELRTGEVSFAECTYKGSQLLETAGVRWCSSPQ